MDTHVNHPPGIVIPFCLAPFMSLMYSCSTDISGMPQAETVLEIKSSYGSPGEKADTIDIFIFNDDRLQRLDSYQRTTIRQGEQVSAASRAGKKIIAVIANSHVDRYSWSGINSFQALCEWKADLKKESKEYILMSGHAPVQAGKGGSCDILLEPLVSEIRIESIRCDFSGKPYDGAVLENPKAYLINVSSEARAFQKDGFIPESILNSGALDTDVLGDFLCPEIIFEEIEGPVGTQVIRPGISLLCYPNESTEEGLGTPFTRLVIEGSINGNICYYPVSVNNIYRHGKNTGTGISRNCRYVFDITIKSTGSSDPDIPVTPADIDITCEILPWEERPDNEIEFKL